MPLIIDRKVIVEKIENLGTFLHKNVAIKVYFAFNLDCY